jgi:3-oxoacyl-[acyl-carrier-protein] synthase III
MRAFIAAIKTHFPAAVLDNERLARETGGWTAEKILKKTGIRERRIAAEGECASDLAAAAAERLFQAGACAPAEIDFILFCTQTPDYLLPTTACLLQQRLGIPRTAGALDFNLGCSGYIYGLGLAKGLIETGQARAVLLLTADTYSKLINPRDRSTRTLFGDGAAATLVRGRAGGEEGIGPFQYGTDGAGAGNLIVPAGGMRQRAVPGAADAVDDAGNHRSVNNLYMNGPELFTFTLRVVPPLVEGLLERSGRTAADIHLFVFHQANLFMLEHLRGKLQIPAERFVICIEDWGNTVSTTIPAALAQAAEAGRLKPGHRVMLLGFGVGYSWGGTLIRWEGD